MGAKPRRARYICCGLVYAHVTYAVIYINAKKLQFVHSINGGRTKTACKVTKIKGDIIQLYSPLLVEKSKSIKNKQTTKE